MLKKLITYKDFDGVTQNEEHYFNLSAPELLDLDLLYEKGFHAHVQQIMKEENKREIVAVIKLLLRLSYGRRTSDNKRFEKKNGQFFDEFTETNAYEELFLNLFKNDGKGAIEFFNGLLTTELFEKAERLKAVEAGELPEDSSDDKPTSVFEKAVEDLTQEDINSLDEAGVAFILKKHKGNIPSRVLLWLGQRS